MTISLLSKRTHVSVPSRSQQHYSQKPKESNNPSVPQWVNENKVVYTYNMCTTFTVALFTTVKR